MSSLEAALDLELSQTDQTEEEFNIEFLEAENERLRYKIIGLENAYNDLERWAGGYIYNYLTGDLAVPVIPDFR